VKVLLTALSGVYGAITKLRNWLFETGILKTFQAPVPVISIGNISAGGTGKTPLVDWVVKFLIEKNVRVAILSRGYGRTLKGVQLVSDGDTIFLNSRQAGDEPLMLAKNNKPAMMVVAEQRKEGVDFLMNYSALEPPEIIVLDDAFQHRQLARDCDIVVVNALKSPFQDAMLPSGRLREPLKGLARADLFFLSKVQTQAQVEDFKQNAKEFNKPIVAGKIKPEGVLSCQANIKLQETETLNKKWFAFSGIGEPGQFLDTLEVMTLHVVGNKAFKDHFQFSIQDVEKLIVLVNEAGADAIITTEKDYARLLSLNGIDELFQNQLFFYVKIGIEFLEGEDVLKEEVLKLLAKKPL